MGKSVPVYFLNADYDYRNMKDWSRPDIDCVHTVGDTIPFPEKITVCVRMMHITYENPVASSYATAFGFGTFLDDWSELDEGRGNMATFCIHLFDLQDFCMENGKQVHGGAIEPKAKRLHHTVGWD